MALTALERKPYRWAEPQVEWLASAEPVPYAEAVLARDRRVAAIAGGAAQGCVWLLEHPAIYTAGTSADEAELLAPARFPVFRSGRDVRAFVASLEDWLIAALAHLGIAGERQPGQIGIFVAGAKIASIGVRVRRWVSLHGVSLNVDPDLEHFSGILPFLLIHTK